MSNHFPVLPTDLNLHSITYVMNFGTKVTQVIPALEFTGTATALFGALTALGSQGGVQFTFTAAGTTGTFDQDAAEASLSEIASAVFALVAALTGQSTTTLAANFSVSRTWNWVDSSGNSATYVDEMPVTLTAITMSPAK